MMTPNARKAYRAAKKHLLRMPKDKLAEALLVLWANLRLDICADPGSIGLPDSGRYAKAAETGSLECVPEDGNINSAADYVDFVNAMFAELRIPEPEEHDTPCG